MSREKLLKSYHQALREAFGAANWWPGDSAFEVMVGAVLTQNTNWGNVVKAIDNLKSRQALDPRVLHAMSQEELSELIRAAGYYRLKAGRLKNLISFLKDSCEFDLEDLASRDMEQLREALLGVKGVGPETADSILLYALKLPSFVVDAYTYRVLTRHALLPEGAGYDEMREFFMEVLEPDSAFYNEFHAYFVLVGKNYCKSQKPLCASCPLASFLS